MLSRTADVEYPDCVDSDEVEYDLALEERTPKIAAEHVTFHIYAALLKSRSLQKARPHQRDILKAQKKT